MEYTMEHPETELTLRVTEKPFGGTPFYEGDRPHSGAETGLSPEELSRYFERDARRYG